MGALHRCELSNNTVAIATARRQANRPGLAPRVPGSRRGVSLLHHCPRRPGPCLRTCHSPSLRILTPVLSTSRSRGPPERRQGDVDGDGPLPPAERRAVRHRPVTGQSQASHRPAKARLPVQTGQSRPASFRRLATMPTVCRRGRPKRTLMPRQNRMAASEKVRGRPGRPFAGASHSIPRSSHTSKEPRRRGDAF
jgi:hypothetical protein